MENVVEILNSMLLGVVIIGSVLLTSIYYLSKKDIL